MPDFDDYLAAIRSHLEVSARRADEICAEVRSHLEEQARQLMQSGVSAEEATAAAVQGFGDAADVAWRLTQANHSHRQVGAARLLFSIALVLVGMWSVRFFGNTWIYAVSRWVGARPGPWDEGLKTLAAAVLMAPVALMGGMAAGRRSWWIASAPMLLWGLALLGFAAANRLVPRGDFLIAGAISVFVAAPLLAASAFLGSRLPQRGPTRCVATALGAGYLGAVLLTGVIQVLRYAPAQEIVAPLLSYLGIAEWLLLLVPGTAALWQRGRPPRRAAIAATVACAVLLFALIDTMAGVDYSVFAREPREDLLWLLRGLVAAESAMALGLGAAVLMVRRAGRRRDDAATAR